MKMLKVRCNTGVYIYNPSAIRKYGTFEWPPVSGWRLRIELMNDQVDTFEFDTMDEALQSLQIIEV